MRLKAIVLSLMISLPSVGLSFYKSTLANVQTHKADSATQTAILAALESCGAPEQPDAGCMASTFQSPHSPLKGSSWAQNIMGSYKAVLNDKQTKKECQIDEVREINSYAADCVFVLHYYVVESLDPELAKNAFDTCLLSRVGGVALEGNIAGIFGMQQIAQDSGRPELSRNWAGFLEDHDDPAEVERIGACYK